MQYTIKQLYELFDAVREQHEHYSIEAGRTVRHAVWEGIQKLKAGEVFDLYKDLSYCTEEETLSFSPSHAFDYLNRTNIDFFDEAVKFLQLCKRTLHVCDIASFYFRKECEQLLKEAFLDVDLAESTKQ